MVISRAVIASPERARQSSLDRHVAWRLAMITAG